MGLESTTSINGLVSTNPVGASDTKSQGDDHLRLLKVVLKATFPGFSGAFNRVQSKSSAYTVVATDNGSVLNVSGTWTLSLTAAATMGNGTSIYVFNNGAGAISIDPDSAETINGASTLSLAAGKAALLFCDGSNWLAIVNVIAGDVAVLSANNAFAGINSFSEGLGGQFLNNLSFTAVVASSAMTIAIKGNDGADPSSTNIVDVAFRNSTITNSSYTVEQITAALSLVIPAGATLGIAAATQMYIAVYLINNAGTVELAVMGRTTKTGVIDESKLVSTTALDSASDSFNVMYSTTARSNVTARFIGMVEVTTGATAGNWDNSPTGLYDDITKLKSLPGFDSFEASDTWIVPQTITLVDVLVIGGGGGGGGGGYGRQNTNQAGGGGGGGGGSGQHRKQRITVTPGSSITITCGAGGAGGAGSTDGTDGSTSSFGSSLFAAGGVGGSAGQDGSGSQGAGGSGGGILGLGTGGTSTSGTAAPYYDKGGLGGAGMHGGSEVSYRNGGAGGAGGDSEIGIGGTGADENTTGGTVGSDAPSDAGVAAGGGGGSGGKSNNTTTRAGGSGATGGDGFVAIWW